MDYKNAVVVKVKKEDVTSELDGFVVFEEDGVIHIPFVCGETVESVAYPGTRIGDFVENNPGVAEIVYMEVTTKNAVNAFMLRSD